MIFGEGPIIKNIAGDLNKLFLQGSRVGQPVTNVEGDAAADQGTVDLLAAMDPVIQEVAVGMSGEESMQYTVSGTPPLSLANSLGMPLRSWSVDVSPYQEGSGDPSPTNIRPVHGTDKITIVTAGKNLYNSATFQTLTRNGVTCTNNGDGSFTLNGTATADAYFNVFRPQFAPAIGGTPLPSANYYLTGCPSNGSANTYYLYITPNYRADYGSGVSFTGQVNDGSIFVKTGFTCNNLVFRPQICLASAPNPMEFAPYIASTNSVITLPYTVYDATVRSDGGESRTRYRLYNGDASEQWTYSATWSRTDTAVFYSNVALTDALFTTFADTYITNCNLLPPKSRQLLYDYDTQGIAYSGNPGPGLHYLTVRIPKTIASTVEEFTAFLAANPLEVVYMLIDPVQFSITAPDIPAPTGTATAWATAEDGTVESMEVTYVGKA